MKWQILAGVRFFLAWVVMCSHLARFVPLDDYLLKFSKFGSLSAVIGFLIISGYSIAHSITKQPKGFYKRRFYRVYPLYFCSIIFSLLPFLIAHSAKVHFYFFPDWITLSGSFFLLQGFTIGNLSSNTIVWTLSIEILCYVLAPLFIKASQRILLIFTLSSALLYFSYSYTYSQYNFPYFTELKYGLDFLLLLWAWLLGFLLFVSHQKSIRFLLIILGLILLKFSLYHGSLYFVTYFLCILPLTYLPNIKLPQVCLQLLTYLGDISYPLYLFHLPCFIFLCGVLTISNSFILVGVSLLTSILFYHIIDAYSQNQRTKRVDYGA